MLFSSPGHSVKLNVKANILVLNSPQSHSGENLFATSYYKDSQTKQKQKLKSKTQQDS